MRNLLTISGLFMSIICSGQIDSLRLKVYSDFVNSDIYTYDTMFNKKTDLLLITSVENFEPTIDNKYLQDYLKGNIESNDFYIKSFNGQDPTVYFDRPPTTGLGKTLKEDKEVGLLLIKLFQNNKVKASDFNDLKTNFKIKIIKDPKSYFKMGWDKFHEKYKNCYGIVRLSKIAFNDNFDRAVFYVESYKGSLDASGDIIVMRKVNDLWTIELYINQWMS